jgi:hypothetical protein
MIVPFSKDILYKAALRGVVTNQFPAKCLIKRKDVRPSICLHLARKLPRRGEPTDWRSQSIRACDGVADVIGARPAARTQTELKRNICILYQASLVKWTSKG